MSRIQEKLCTQILKETFGEVVSKVGKFLMSKGINSLSAIVEKLKIPRQKVQKSLCVLIKHNLVEWEKLKAGLVGYSINMDRVTVQLRIPSYIALARELFGEAAEVIAENLARDGQATASDIIIKATVKIINGSKDSKEINNRHVMVYNALETLVNNEFVQRCPAPLDETGEVPEMCEVAEITNRFCTELIDIKSLSREIESILNYGKPNYEDMFDRNVYWKLNYHRFNLELRDRKLKQYITNRINTKAGECFGKLLEASCKKSGDPWKHTFYAITASQINKQQESDLEQYLKIISENSDESLRKVGNTWEREYELSVGKLVNAITIENICSIIQEKFGSKAARIFRIVREKVMIEEDRISKLSLLLDEKEAQLLTNKLMKANFLRVHEVRKAIAASSFSSNSIFLFHIDINSLVKKLLEWHYKAIYNFMKRRESLTEQHKRLIVKNNRVESLVAAIKVTGGPEEQIKEVEEMFTPTERESLKKYLKLQELFFSRENFLDEDCFIFQLFLIYNTNRNFFI